MKIKKLIFIILTLLFLSCTEKEYNSEKMYFNVDPHLLDEVFRDDQIGISFSPPLNWKSWSREILDDFNKLNQESSIPSANKDIVLTAVFSDSLATNFCMISKIESSQWILKDYLIKLAELNENTEIKQTKFLLNENSFTQIIIIKEDAIDIKLITEINIGINIIWDYLIARDQYNHISRMIESSIGSINIINEGEQ